MIKVLKGDYECPTCKKMTTIGRTKKMDEPLTCCGVEMVPKEKTKFTEVPEAEESPAPKAKSATRTKKKKSKKSASASDDGDAAKRKKRVMFEATLPLAPGTYICQACGKTHELHMSDPRDKWLRCTDCYVKMVPVR